MALLAWLLCWGPALALTVPVGHAGSLQTQSPGKPRES